MAQGKGDTFKKTNKSKCTLFFLPLSDLLTMQLLQSCKQYLNAFQPPSLKMSRKKKGGDSLAGVLWSSSFTFWEKFRQPQGHSCYSY